jgi:hypothetical protein
VILVNKDHKELREIQVKMVELTILGLDMLILLVVVV